MKDDFIPLSVPFINGNEREYILNCLNDNWVSTAGPFIAEFERRFAIACGAKRAVACACGTAALHLALLGLEIGKGDVVLVPDLTFIATANAVRYTGAKPIFIDVDAKTAQLDVNLLRDFLATECEDVSGKIVHRRSGERVSAILPVHLLGHACDMPKIKALADAYQIPVIEDAAEAVGVTVEGRKAGTWGKAGCYSFNGNKMITAGAGGMIVTDDVIFADRLKHLSEQAKLTGNEYIHDEIGFNYRMSNLHAAMGVAQLEQLKEFIYRKREIAARYQDAFKAKKCIEVIEPGENVASIWWLFTILLDEEDRPNLARELISYLAEQSIQARPLWQPMHLSPSFSELRDEKGYRNATRFYNSAVSLPSSVGLSKDDQNRVISAVLRYLDEKQ